MKRILILLTVLALAALCVCAQAEESAVAWGRRFTALETAQRELFNRYGITEAMNDYFTRGARENQDGTYTVCWWPSIREAHVESLMGKYIAEVNPDEGTAVVTWSRDGVSTEGGMTAPAWGAPQISMLMEAYRETFETDPLLKMADTAAEGQGFPESTDFDAEMENYPFFLGGDSEDGGSWSEGALAAAKLSGDELSAIGRAALAEKYPILLRNLPEDRWTGSIVYGMLDGQPVAAVSYDFLGYNTGGEWAWSEGDGYYTVWINTVTGEVEEILYQCGLYGNG